MQDMNPDSGVKVLHFVQDFCETQSLTDVLHYIYILSNLEEVLNINLCIKLNKINHQ